jgi:hypothetical protein
LETDPPYGPNRRDHELPDGVECDLELVIVLPFKRFDLSRQVTMTDSGFSQPKEYADDFDANSNRNCAVQDTGQHESAMFRKSERQRGRKLELSEVIAFCDHLELLGASELEHEIGRKPIAVPSDLFVQATGR